MNVYKNRHWPSCFKRPLRSSAQRQRQQKNSRCFDCELKKCRPVPDDERRRHRGVERDNHRAPRNSLLIAMTSQTRRVNDSHKSAFLATQRLRRSANIIARYNAWNSETSLLFEVASFKKSRVAYSRVAETQLNSTRWCELSEGWRVPKTKRGKVKRVMEH